MRCEVMECREDSTFTVARRGREVIIVLDPTESDDVIDLCDGHYTRLRWGFDLAMRAAGAEAQPSGR